MFISFPEFHIVHTMKYTCFPKLSCLITADGGILYSKWAPYNGCYASHSWRHKATCDVTAALWCHVVRGCLGDVSNEDLTISGNNQFTNLQHRISATGWLLVMRCVSFTFIRLLPTWTPTEIFDSFWAKHFSDCDFMICPIKSKLRFLKVCKILKRTWHFQTDWILCVVNCSGCSHVVNDAGSTCSCC